jgi:hypothetical protein
MTSYRWFLVLCTALLAVSLGSPVPASAEEEDGRVEAIPVEAAPVEAPAAGDDRNAEKLGEDPGAPEEEAEADEPGEVVVIETELTSEELWMLTSPWEDDEEIVVHGAGSSRGDSRIPTHGGGSSGEGITTHTQTSGEEDRIPVTRSGEANDADIVVHGGGREGPSRIRVH